MSNNAAAQFTPPSLLLTTIGLSLATFMQVLDTTIANVALPTISGNLGVSYEQGTWVITSFAVSNAIALPLTGWLSRRFGEVKLFIWATLLFVLASFLCGIAQSMPELVGFRVLQGVVAGPLYPMTQTLLIAVYPPAKRGMALALLAMVTVVAPIAGPILGGWITDSYSWPWIFFINVPIGLFAAAVVRQQMRTRPVVTSRQPMDYIGLLTLIIGVGALQVVLDKGNDLDWFESSFIIVGSLISVVFLAVFVIWELTDRHPVVNLRLFVHRNFRVGTIVLVGGVCRVLRYQPDPAAVVADADGLHRDLGGPGGGADWLAAGDHVAFRGQVCAPVRLAGAGGAGVPGDRYQLLHARGVHQ